MVCPASTLESELQRRTDVFGYKLTDDDKAVLVKGGVIKDAEMQYGGQTRKGDIHFDAFRQSIWAVDPNFAEKVGLKKENGKEVSQQQSAKQEQKAEQKEEPRATSLESVRLSSHSSSEGGRSPSLFS